jgi:hypothetical protein
MSRYPEIDLSRVRTYSVRRRKSLVRAEGFLRAVGDPGSFTEFWASLPDVLAVRDLRELVVRVRGARARGAGVLAMAGGHVLKTGLGPGLIRLMEDGWITSLALNGAGTIHDLEIAFFGTTSEDVAAQLPRGRFGMARETSAWLNRWTVEAATRGEGLGEGLGRAYLENAPPNGAARSVLASAYRLGVPVTVHLAIGGDINHQHPGFDGAAAGATSARDFRILCAQVSGLGEGVALNLGSAVILPEVFLKAVSVCTNLGTPFPGLTTAVFDFQRQYRPGENVVRRPTLRGGRGFYLVGHHEILLPLFFQALRLGGPPVVPPPVRRTRRPGGAAGAAGLRADSVSATPRGRVAPKDKGRPAAGR